MVYNAYISPLRVIPGPKLCSLSEFSIMIRRPEGRVFEWFYQLHHKYGSVVRVGPKFILFSSKEAVRQILVINDLPKIDSIAGIRADPEIATLFSATDRIFHKQRKRLLSPAFSIKYIASLEPLMQSCINVLVDRIKTISSITSKSDLALKFNENGLPIVNIHQLIQATSLDIIGETAFGESFNLVEKGDHPLPGKVFQELKRRVLYHTFPYMRPFLKKDSWTDEFIQKIIKERRNLNAQGKTREDILQIILDTRDEVTNEGLNEFEIQDQIMEFLIAGSDTSSFSINMALIMLLHHPEKLRNLINELSSAFPNGPQSLNHENLKDLKYLNAVINEILRRFPAAMGGILRQTNSDMMIDGYFVPKDTIVSASIYQVQHSKEIWGVDADEFVPERWINGDSVKLKRNIFTFGAGSRLCIGNNFAMMEIRLVLASLLLNFEFEMVEKQDLQIVQFITPSLRSKKFDVGIRVRN
ncbi:cytochrome P450 [Rhizophagus irregularis]|uniref:Cytochrome P450 n=4 Tax=Rhizophagus irregularis TaxID=588596 RepID=U9UJG8_RHIID|nr:cytochrome P450 [Rhizophagus irregularis DAOM 181602=DAOM 197198]EXX75722.1 Dit2p [Rhizophagus irregularis DAOM 197198w]PKC15061.1 cytochrome P450 [Rhizophagus irregularis]PKC65513.1 cytochrome P450 [Rhizophagus irregularis]PKK64807.1 cytochrome P450 [Rhizophagus irregularis]PKY20339.1 cytochrome P450 [Rhizophagus irregularis]|eukprot:XP_025167889.1 cytochrome P450 [Rhizophagus irregularis DAOM 181602=DAOM 197198]